jgi:carboxypeptidase C (cathepsin A)
MKTNNHKKNTNNYLDDSKKNEPLYSNFAAPAPEQASNTKSIIEKSNSIVNENSNNPVITKGKINIKGKLIPYTATTGYMNIMDDDDKGIVVAKMFYISYVRSYISSSNKKRPVTFAFNGGPGSSSVWLHMGALGPKRVVLTKKGDMMKPPGSMINNEYSWLKFTDLVFIDPISTGYSRPEKDENKEQFHGLDEDVKSVGKFVYSYTTQNNRWLSPKFIAGESYGTTRAAHLSNHLIERYGMYVNGLVLISMVLDFQTTDFNISNELPFALFIPTYTATAMYHGKLDSDLTADKENTLQEVRDWVLNNYIVYLSKGQSPSKDEHNEITEKLSKYTGLSKNFIISANNRIDIQRFTKELLRVERKTVGRLDSRFTGFDRDAAGENYEHDPSYENVIYGPFTATLHHHIRDNLGFKSDLPYEILTDKVNPWNYGDARNGFPSVSESLRKAMTKNRFLKVYIANGWYDFATPFFASEYTINHLSLEPVLQKNISMKYYRSGHMVYIKKSSLIQFTKDVDTFYSNTLS